VNTLEGGRLEVLAVITGRNQGFPSAGFAVYDAADKSITFSVFPTTQKAQHRIIAASLPDHLAAGLTFGR
jgi:hypothetical protein